MLNKRSRALIRRDCNGGCGRARTRLRIPDVDGELVSSHKRAQSVLQVRHERDAVAQPVANGHIAKVTWITGTPFLCGVYDFEKGSITRVGQSADRLIRVVDA